MIAGMIEHEIIFEYFPHLNAAQKRNYLALQDIYKFWNERINLISRKDFPHFYERHVLHSLSIGKFCQFNKGAYILDLGTGGGFPGIPLAIMFPEVEFLLVDSIGKKIKVVEDVIRQLNLTNATAIQERAEKIFGSFDFVVSRAVAPVDKLYYWTASKLSDFNQHSIRNGLICLKGGDLTSELHAFEDRAQVVDLHKYFKEFFFDGKKLVYIPKE